MTTKPKKTTPAKKTAPDKKAKLSKREKLLNIFTKTGDSATMAQIVKRTGYTENSANATLSILKKTDPPIVIKREGKKYVRQ